MLEGPSRDTDLVWEARLEGMAPEIDGRVYITGFADVTDAAQLPPPGTLATIEVTQSKQYDLIGRVVQFSARRTPPPANDANNLFPILASG
jgi:ribosomal protein S12 methylthiotransferase